MHHPREIIRVERDYAHGELAQFAATYPLELEGRVSALLPNEGYANANADVCLQITPTQFLDTINTINEHLIAAHSLRNSFIDNAMAFFTLQLSRIVMRSYYEKACEISGLW